MVTAPQAGPASITLAAMAAQASRVKTMATAIPDTFAATIAAEKAAARARLASATPGESGFPGNRHNQPAENLCWGDMDGPKLCGHSKIRCSCRFIFPMC
jgi:hypothetical protein